MDLSGDTLLFRVMMLIPLLLSLTVHEWAHAWSAWKLGDDTAAMQGRLTLDPLAHMDPIGTFLLPLLGVPFGWAKPVPVNPARFNRNVNMRFGMMLTAAAGPLSNILLAVIAAVAYGLLWRFSPGLMMENPALQQLIAVVIPMNVGLAIFNMLPIPPLDGSRIADYFMPHRMQPLWENLTRLAPLLLIGVIAVGGAFLSGPISFVTALIHELIRSIAVA